MKILQISSAESLGGGERHLADLANGLAARGHEVFAALRPNSRLFGELHAIPKENITTLALRNSLDAKSARDLLKLVRENEIQIVHAHMARDYPLAAYSVRNNDDARLIVTRHVLFPLNPLHRLTLSRAARVIAVSEGVKSQLVSDRSAPAEKISVVLNGIDAARFQVARRQFDRHQFLGKWKLPNDAILIGTVGELTPLKGQDEFVRAAAQISKQFPTAFFVIAGTGREKGNEYRTTVKNLLAEFDLTKRVKLVGWLEDLAQLYCALDVFVSASHTESFGLAIAEAMASSTAVVATETAGAQEIIQDGKTGVLVPIGDVDRLAGEIILLLNNNERKARLGAAASQVVAERFDLGRMIEETERIYREEIEKSG